MIFYSVLLQQKIIDFGSYFLCNFQVVAKKKSKGSDTESDSSDSDSDDSSEYSSSSESDSGSYSETESDDNYAGYRSTRRRPTYNRSAGANGKKSMQDKVEEIQRGLAGISSKSKPLGYQTESASMALCRRACDMRDQLLDKIEELGKRLPSNTLDQLIEELGGPDEVAVSE